MDLLRVSLFFASMRSCRAKFSSCPDGLKWGLTFVLQRLTTALDQPTIPWKPLVITFSISQYMLQTYLSWRQYQVLKRTQIPAALSKEIDQETYDKSQAYGRAKSRYGFISGGFTQVLDLLVLKYDVFPKLWSVVGGWLGRAGVLAFLPEACKGEIGHSLIFMWTFGLTTTLIGLPFDYYYHFILEEKFGFNKQTIKLWIQDFVKGQALTIAFGIPIGSAFLAIVRRTGDNFFYYLYLFALAVQLFAITIYPIFIIPLFNKLTPLSPGDLKTQVEQLAQKLKFPLTELQVIDGSKRSAHSNAYFAGLPWKKKIVLFDTLIEKSSEEEVVAVLAHELGHWKLGHTTQQLGIAQFHLFFIFTLFSAFVHNRSLYSAFGFTKEQPIIIGFMLFNEVLAPTDAVLKLAMNVLSRRFEFQADKFGKDLGYAEKLAQSLIKLQIQNLSAMDADWMYSAYTYSHPILTERLGALGWKSEVKVGASSTGKEKSAGQVGEKEL